MHASIITVSKRGASTANQRCTLGPAASGMLRRGMETEVSRRIGWQAREVMQRRLELVAELVVRERRQLEGSIIASSTDIAAAKRERRRQRQNRQPVDEHQRLHESNYVLSPTARHAL